MAKQGFRNEHKQSLEKSALQQNKTTICTVYETSDTNRRCKQMAGI